MAPSPGPPEGYAARFDGLFRAQRAGFRRCLEGLLLPAERDEALTALVNTQPVVGARRKEARGPRRFPSESSSWEPAETNARSIELLSVESGTAPNERGVLVTDEHGDRERGENTAHAGKQRLADMGEAQGGVVSAPSLCGPTRGLTTPWRSSLTRPRATSRAARTTPGSAPSREVGAPARGAVGGCAGLPFEAVAESSSYGEDEQFEMALRNLGVGYVLSFKRSRCRWHKEGEVGALRGTAEAAGWQGEDEPGSLVKG